MQFQAISERHALDDFSKFPASPQPSLPVLCALPQLVDHVQHAGLGQASPRLARAMPDGGEGRLDWWCGCLVSVRQESRRTLTVSSDPWSGIVPCRLHTSPA